jgi:hypothetical protein
MLKHYLLPGIIFIGFGFRSLRGKESTHEKFASQ